MKIHKQDKNSSEISHDLEEKIQDLIKKEIQSHGVDFVTGANIIVNTLEKLLSHIMGFLVSKESLEEAIDLFVENFKKNVRLASKKFEMDEKDE